MKTGYIRMKAPRSSRNRYDFYKVFFVNGSNTSPIISHNVEWWWLTSGEINSDTVFKTLIVIN